MTIYLVILFDYIFDVLFDESFDVSIDAGPLRTIYKDFSGFIPMRMNIIITMIKKGLKSSYRSLLPLRYGRFTLVLKTLRLAKLSKLSSIYIFYLRSSLTHLSYLSNTAFSSYISIIIRSFQDHI